MSRKRKNECPDCAKLEAIYEQERAILKEQDALLARQSSNAVQSETVKVRLVEIYDHQSRHSDDATETGVRYLARADHFYEIAKKIMLKTNSPNKCGVKFF